MTDSLRLIAAGPIVTLKKCRPGLFLHNGKVGLKSSSHSMSGGTVMPDAYDGYGEYFWGGAVSPTERSNLRVLPLTVMVEPEVIGGGLHGRTDLDHSEPLSSSQETVSAPPEGQTAAPSNPPRRGRPKRTEPYPWEVAGVPKSTWLRHEKKKAEGK